MTEYDRNYANNREENKPEEQLQITQHPQDVSLEGTPSQPSSTQTRSTSHSDCMDVDDIEELRWSMSVASGSTGSDARSYSPSGTDDGSNGTCIPNIRMVDLRACERLARLKSARTPDDVPEDVRQLFKEIRDLTRSKGGVVPLGIEVRTCILALLSL
jgi:hypothetical protein